jgi:hypothetical protein
MTGFPDQLAPALLYPEGDTWRERSGKIVHESQKLATPPKLATDLVAVAGQDEQFG